MKTFHASICLGLLLAISACDEGSEGPDELALEREAELQDMLESVHGVELDPAGEASLLEDERLEAEWLTPEGLAEEAEQSIGDTADILKRGDESQSIPIDVCAPWTNSSLPFSYMPTQTGSCGAAPCGPNAAPVSYKLRQTSYQCNTERWVPAGTGCMVEYCGGGPFSP